MATDDDHHDRAGAAGGAPGWAGLSGPARLVVVCGALVVAMATVVHLTMVFLHVAPANTVSRQHAAAISEYVLPEFEQNWKLFAPNPLQQNIAVQARLRLRGPDGRTTATPWTDLTAQDGAAIRHNPLPSHTRQNELRRAWDFYAGTHDEREQPTGMRGRLSEAYLRRIALSRLDAGRGQVDQLQVRTVTSAIGAPPWSDQRSPSEPVYRELAWWPVTGMDLAGVSR